MDKGERDRSGSWLGEMSGRGDLAVKIELGTGEKLMFDRGVIWGCNGCDFFNSEGFRHR